MQLQKNSKIDNIKNKISLLFRNPSEFKTRAKNYFSSSYIRLQPVKDAHILVHAVAKILKTVLDKGVLRTGYIGTEILDYTESFSDCGCIWEDPHHCFFDNDPNDRLRPYNPLENINIKKFDVLFLGIKDAHEKEKALKKLENTGAIVIDFYELMNIFRKITETIKGRHFKSCLNLNKLATILFFTYLCPSHCNIVEVGAYQCGTSILMAKTLQYLNRKSKIYALDTFAGMPSSTEQDREGSVWYESGMFTENNIRGVQKRVKCANVENQVILCPGLVQDTLPSISKNSEHISFMFLDTDQYAGTLSGLSTMLSRKDNNWFVVIDDTTVKGVDLAINEIIAKHPHLKRKNIFTNFDIVFSDTTTFNWSI